MFEDKKFGNIFPTRTGTPSGASNERKMLDAIGGSDSYRTRLQNNMDGSTTMLRTKNGMPQFSTSKAVAATESPIFMDSGLIDLNGMGTESQNRFNNGVLHYGDTQRLYQQLKKLLGNLWPSSMVCEPPNEDEPASSFFASLDQLGNQPLLDRLYLKKLCSAFAGASMFCGKARLYAQAQYGTKLADWKWALSIGGTYQLQSTVSSAKLSTNSGVYLDSEFNHWLLDMDNAGVRISQLKRDSRILPLVKQWAAMSPTDPDYDKVEAYILAYSYPADDTSFWLHIPGTPACDMFGYGWKFNWSGDTCDIVTTNVVSTGVTTSKYISTHYRVRFSYGGASTVAQDRWSANLETIEGPVEWKSDKWAQVVSYPVWGENVLGIFGELWGDRFGDAPVYCFYKRDDLEVIRCKYEGGEDSVKYASICTPSVFFNRTFDWTIDNVDIGNNQGTIGRDGGSGEHRTQTQNPVRAGFYSGTVDGTTYAHYYDFERYTVSAKQITTTTWYTQGTWTSQYHDGRETYDAGPSAVSTTSDGVTVYGGGVTTVLEPTTYLGYGDKQWTQTGTIECSRFHYSGGVGVSADAVLVIPFFDAEAAYIYATETTSESATGTGGWASGTSGTGFVIENIHGISDGAGINSWVHCDQIFAASSAFLPAAPSTPAPDISTHEHAIVCNTVLTSTGNYAFTPTSSMSPFFAGEPNTAVSQTWGTRVSIDGAVFGEGVRILKGFDDFESPLPFVGWA